MGFVVLVETKKVFPNNSYVIESKLLRIGLASIEEAQGFIRSQPSHSPARYSIAMICDGPMVVRPDRRVVQNRLLHTGSEGD